MEKSIDYYINKLRKKKDFTRLLVDYPHIKLLEEGISFERQKQLGVKYDLMNQEIIIPIKN